MQMLMDALEKVAPPAPVEELVELLCTVKDGQILAMAWDGDKWNYLDVTDFVNQGDKAFLYGTQNRNRNSFWHRVGKRMKLW